MRYFLDTNILIRVIAEEDKKTFLDCLNLLNLIKQGKIKASISTIVFAEVAWVLKSPYKFTKSKIIKYLKSILALKNLKLTDSLDLKKAVNLYSKYNIKFTDCLVAANNDLLNKKAILISYDKDFDKLPIKRIEPEKIVKKFK